MSVILTDVDIPKNCSECPCLHHGEYGAFEKSWCNLDSKLRISDRNCPNGCKIKSVDGLIEFIKDHSYPVRYDRNSIEQGMTIAGVECAIKEYCGMETGNAE